MGSIFATNVPNNETLVKDAKNHTYQEMAEKYGCTVNTLYKHFRYIPKELRPKPNVGTERVKKTKKEKLLKVAATRVSKAEQEIKQAVASRDILTVNWQRVKETQTLMEQDIHKAFTEPLLKVSVEEGVLLDRMRA